jgi:hypothetical protein
MAQVPTMGMMLSLMALMSPTEYDLSFDDLYFTLRALRGSTYVLLVGAEGERQGHGLLVA